MSKNKWDTELYKAEVSKIHNHFFDYSKTEYINFRTKVLITCPVHGDFWQLPQTHLRGGGCLRCSKDNEARQRIENFGIFKERANKKHGGFYEYPEDGFLNCKTKVKIKCPDHGYFYQYPNNHLKFSGCPKCDGYMINSVSRGTTVHIPRPRSSEVVPLTKGKYAFVDEEDYELVVKYNWYLSDEGYAVSRIKGKLTRMHRFLMGVTDNAEQIDHKNGNRLDNRKNNLRVVDNQKNCLNKKKTRGTSKYKGVSFYKAGKKWMSVITYDYKKYFLGYFENEDDAARAYNKKAEELFLEYARVNPIVADMILCKQQVYTPIKTIN